MMEFSYSSTFHLPHQADICTAASKRKHVLSMLHHFPKTSTSLQAACGRSRPFIRQFRLCEQMGGQKIIISMVQFQISCVIMAFSLLYGDAMPFTTHIDFVSTYMPDTSNGGGQTGREFPMEGTKDDESPLPKPEPLSPKALLRRRKAKGKASGSGTARATREMLMERDRRGKMNEFYVKLNSMVPNLFPKATREKTIDETIAYIREVEEQIAELEAQKEKAELERLHGRRNSSSSIDVTFSGETMFFGIQSMARKGLLTRVLQVFERHKAEVLATSIACNDGQQATVTVTAVFNHSDRMVLPPEIAGQRIKSDLLGSL